MDDKPLASPACALSEAPDAWRGYLTPADIAAQLASIGIALREQGRGDLAERIAEISRTLPESDAAAPAPDIAAAFDRLLPRIRDDRLHAAIAALRATL